MTKEELLEKFKKVKAQAEAKKQADAEKAKGLTKKMRTTAKK